MMFRHEKVTVKPVILISSLILLMIGCAPRVEQCVDLFPCSVDNPEITRVGKTYILNAEKDGIPVSLELVRSGLGWKRGLLRVDGEPSTPDRFDSDVKKAKLKRAARKSGKKVKELLDKSGEAIQEFVEGLKKH